MWDKMLSVVRLHMSYERIYGWMKKEYMTYASHYGVLNKNQRLAISIATHMAATRPR